jgi:hypothetical protein
MVSLSNHHPHLGSLIQWKGSIHPHLNPLPSRERKITEGVLHGERGPIRWISLQGEED